ncbi:hypothetical protein ACFY3O_32940 [Streptomyces sp. NPDC001046]|uniref:hypothetical protein n=1 Tax=Streptomyces sp. NPDC001046 TaxID=3364543 RepID=UPI00367B2313
MSLRSRLPTATAAGAPTAAGPPATAAGFTPAAASDDRGSGGGDSRQDRITGPDPAPHRC